MSAYEVCVATPFGPHVIARAETSVKAERVAAAERPYQQATVFVRQRPVTS